VPVTLIEDSCVRSPISDQEAWSTSFGVATACTTPVPSRTCRKAIFPLERLLYSQPRRVTVSPS